jgi:phosphoribosylaminoimidazole carboxylase PurE protein
MTKKIGIILGSDSDFPYIEKSIDLLDDLDHPFEIEVSSAHRTPERTRKIIADYEKKGVRIIIAAAGGAAHLPGVIASHTLLPVLGVPINSILTGVDSLYSIVQMPAGVPVATFGIGEAGAINAVLFALEVLSLNDEILRKKLTLYRKKQQEKVLIKSKKLKQKLKSK